MSSALKATPLSVPPWVWSPLQLLGRFCGWLWGYHLSPKVVRLLPHSGCHLPDSRPFSFNKT